MYVNSKIIRENVCKTPCFYALRFVDCKPKKWLRDVKPDNSEGDKGRTPESVCHMTN